MSAIARVWIAEGCIGCHACEYSAPDVFALPDGAAVVLGDVRCDGQTSDNRTERSLLNAVGLESEELIREAVEGCPVEIIHFAST